MREDSRIHLFGTLDTFSIVFIVIERSFYLLQISRENREKISKNIFKNPAFYKNLLFRYPINFLLFIVVKRFLRMDNTKSTITCYLNLRKWIL